MADDTSKAESGLHVRQAEGHARPDQRVQRRDGVWNCRDDREEDRPNRREKDNFWFFHRRDRHVRVRHEAGHDQERRLRLPAVRQYNVQEHAETDDRPGVVDDLPLGD